MAKSNAIYQASINLQHGLLHASLLRCSHQRHAHGRMPLDQLWLEFVPLQSSALRVHAATLHSLCLWVKATYTWSVQLARSVQWRSSHGTWLYVFSIHWNCLRLECRKRGIEGLLLDHNYSSRSYQFLRSFQQDVCQSQGQVEGEIEIEEAQIKPCDWVED